jgi:hypothetical protein
MSRSSMPRIAFSCVVASAMVLVGCSSSDATAPRADAPTDAGVAETSSAPLVEAELERLLTGRFDSADQASSDKAYFAISLRICKVTSSELGPRVLYVEQARMETLGKPYRQRLYVIERRDERTAVSQVLELTSPKDWVGACDEPSPRSVTKAESVERPGCAVILKRQADGSFVGSTADLEWNGSAFEKSNGGVRCASDLNGATYASSEVTLDEGGLLSWDRGFDDAGKQVWGATAGGYRFVRRP